MGITDTNLFFHESFRPELEYISEILKLGLEKYEGDKNEISKETGIPTGKSTGKVIPHIIYAKYMGLINYKISNGKYMLEVTELGRIVGEEDIYLKEDISKLLLNYNLTDIENGAPQWVYLFKKFDSDIVFTRELLQNEIDKYFGKLVKLPAVIKTYTEAFASLELLVENERNFEFKVLDIKDENVYVYAYTLLNSWDMYFKKSKEITFNDVVDVIKWGNPLGFNNMKCLEALELLEEYGVIKLNKLLSPLTVIRLQNIEDVKYNLYSMLL